ncbi:NAD(+) diphosphatase [Microbacterium fluvii]
MSDIPQPPLARGGLDRAGDERSEPGLLDRLRSDSSTRVLVVAGDRAPFDGDGLQLVAPAAVPAGALWAFLGRDDEGSALLAAVLAHSDDAPFDAPGGWAGLRVAGGMLTAADAAAFVAALALGRWLLGAPFCPACGGQTRIVNAGWARHCDACGRDHFPRTDPAVIVAVTHRDDPDRLLLGSNALWEVNRYSCFAGFVEAGESAEEAVRREVREESGVEVGALEYRGSQSWPYPRSLMLGYRAQALSDAAVADGDEIAEVRWFTRAEIGEGLRGEGDVMLPGTASIAHQLIADWHAGR